MTAAVRVEGDVAHVTFRVFDLDDYDLFVRTKRLPESTTRYDWRADTYTVETAARFAPMLGADAPARPAERLPVAGHLRDYQRWALEMALSAKRYALWLDTGLGKTSVYLEWARQVIALTGGRVLILAPLAVIPQIIEEAARWYGDALPVAPLHSRDELAAWCAAGNGVAICNYEKFIRGTMPELRYVAGMIADESSVLKTGGGKIKWNLIKSARGIEYKLSCTATPAPNEAMEYASQAAFLEKLRSEGDILWTFFSRDKRGEWRVKPHALGAFYAFMASWSLYMRDPARFGFADILSTLPDPVVSEERLEMTPEQRARRDAILVRAGAGLWGDDRMGVQERQALAQIARGFRYVGENDRKRAERIPSAKPARVAEIVREEVAAGRRVLVWTTFDEEGEIIREQLDDAPFGAAVLDGSQSQETRTRLLAAFRSGEIVCLISKPQLIGYGLNLQYVGAMVFSGLDDSYERMYQAIRRAVRPGQAESVRIHVPYVPELEGLVFGNVKRKEARFLADVAAQEEQYRRVLGR